MIKGRKEKSAGIAITKIGTRNQVFIEKLCFCYQRQDSDDGNGSEYNASGRLITVSCNLGINQPPAPNAANLPEYLR